MKILMVCMGNICRSPMAEGILRKKAEQHALNITIDSAGTGAWHEGERPDRRAIETAKTFGVDISRLIARQFTVKDFETFDRIYVMDYENLRHIHRLARTEEDQRKVSLLLETIYPGDEAPVPDPYYGGGDGFVEVFKMMDSACDAIVKEIKNSRSVHSRSEETLP
jgi:protein-tyrosine phosphatase